MLELREMLGLPTVAQNARWVARLRQGYSGQPSRSIMSEGWRAVRDDFRNYLLTTA